MMKTTLQYFWVTILAVIFLLLGTPLLYAQTPNSPLEDFIGTPRIYKIDVRSASLGEAGIADAGYFTSFSINPALLGFNPDKSNIHFSGYQNWENNLLQYALTPPAFSTRNHTGIFRVGYFHTGLSHLNPLGDIEQAEPHLKIYQIDAGYSYAFNRTFSLGVLNTFSYADNSDTQYWTYSANTGLFYDPIGAVAYGIVLRGLGRSVQYKFNESGSTLLRSHNMPLILDIGATLRFPANKEESVFSLSLSNEKRFKESGIWYKGGIEARPVPYLALRSGLLFKPEAHEYLPRFGIGLNTAGLKLDYGVSPSLYHNERFHQFGITLNI